MPACPLWVKSGHEVNGNMVSHHKFGELPSSWPGRRQCATKAHRPCDRRVHTHQGHLAGQKLKDAPARARQGRLRGHGNRSRIDFHPDLSPDLRSEKKLGNIPLQKTDQARQRPSPGFPGSSSFQGGAGIDSGRGRGRVNLATLSIYPARFLKQLPIPNFSSRYIGPHR